MAAAFQWLLCSQWPALPLGGHDCRSLNGFSGPLTSVHASWGNNRRGLSQARSVRNYDPPGCIRLLHHGTFTAPDLVEDTCGYLSLFFLPFSIAIALLKPLPPR
jgi:hypothetical protein